MEWHESRNRTSYIILQSVKVNKFSDHLSRFEISKAALPFEDLVGYVATVLPEANGRVWFQLRGSAEIMPSLEPSVIFSSMRIIEKWATRSVNSAQWGPLAGIYIVPLHPK